ncbi:MAG: protein NO VEIN domain-containing protein, partial [Pirellulaceae bacterium]
RDREADLEIVEAGRPWSFSGDGNLLRLVSEARRIQLAYLFDPVLAVHTSLVEPFPHQITAVYEEMLPRQPLRYLLADDPGAGKTIMAGLFIKELLVRGDVHRCMIVAPGNLVEQWQDELSEKFHLLFEIMTNDKFESSQAGNWFLENPLAVCRLDKLSRNELVQEKLRVTDWDLIVVDEAHKMSASYFGGEKKETKRYKLGKFLSSITRHFLLMTATPHNGKEEDFQLFMALLDGDRFEGKFRDGVHVSDTSDVMRRMVKEQLVKFDETPLFPERRAYAVNYDLSDGEAALYKEVTDYVREEFNRADALQNDGRRGTVGFALTILQRRLASSPEAIFQSLRRRGERLEKRLREEKLMKRGASSQLEVVSSLPSFQDDDDIIDFEDSPGDEFEDQEESIVDQATAAGTIAELESEVKSVSRLEQLAQQVRRSGTDRKWEELSSLLQDNEHHSIQDAHVNPDGSRRVVSRQMQFVSIDRNDNVRMCGYAPYLDYRAATEEERSLVEPLLAEDWLNRGLEQRAVSYAVSELVPRHFQEVRNRKEELVDKTLEAVKDRLNKEINHWDHRAQVLKAQEEAGKTPRLNSAKAQARADDLDSRLQKRIAELEQERKLSPLPPVAIGGALVVSAGLLARLGGKAPSVPGVTARETDRVEKLAMDAVMQTERDLGHDPRDVSVDNCGYDIESRDGQSGHLRFIEVKGRVVGAKTVAITRNEIVTGINTRASFILAIVQVDGDDVQKPVYVREPFEREPDFDVTSVNYKLAELLQRGGPPL